MTESVHFVIAVWRAKEAESIKGRARFKCFARSPRSLNIEAHMSALPKKVTERLVAAIKKFQPILMASKARDDGEADTSMIVTDMLAEVFGYDKFSEVTGEHAIRGTYCDLATKLEGVVQSLIEVKAVGLELKDPNVKQAVDYAANQGVDWVVLTNGIRWRIYSITFAKPIGQELVVDIDFCSLSPKNDTDLESLYYSAKKAGLSQCWESINLESRL